MDKKTIWDLDRVDVETFKNQQKINLVILLDNVRSLNNIGSIFRTADGFSLERIILCGISSPPPSPEIHKTALGAEDSVDWEYCQNTAKAIKTLKDNGYTVCCLEQVNGSTSLEKFQVEPDRKYVIVVGHEVDGVSQDAVDLCDCCIEIPQHGTKHSLNVSISAALAMWHFYLGLRKQLHISD